jgi:hypothetical protein
VGEIPLARRSLHWAFTIIITITNSPKGAKELKMTKKLVTVTIKSYNFMVHDFIVGFFVGGKKLYSVDEEGNKYQLNNAISQYKDIEPVPIILTEKSVKEWVERAVQHAKQDFDKRRAFGSALDDLYSYCERSINANWHRKIDADQLVTEWLQKEPEKLTKYLEKYEKELTPELHNKLIKEAIKANKYNVI